MRQGSPKGHGFSCVGMNLVHVHFNRDKFNLDLKDFITGFSFVINCIIIQPNFFLFPNTGTSFSAISKKITDIEGGSDNLQVP